MSGTTITSNYSTAITLSTAYTAIDSGGSISVSGGPAIFGPASASAAWTLFNQGSVYGNSNSGAVALRTGGVVTNAASASIFAGQTGIQIQNGAGTVINAGGISASNYGIKIYGNGSVTNTGTISSGSDSGIKVYSGSGSIANYGIILGTITLHNGGLVSNANAGTISVGTGNAVILGSRGQVINQGYILGSNYGISIHEGTVSNFGTIKGGTKAISFTGGGLVVDNPGAVFIGTVEGFQSDGAMTLELARGGAGFISGIGSSFTNFTSVLVDSGATWTLSGTNDVTASQVAANLTNSGTLTVTGSLYDAGAATGTGQIDIAAGGTVVLASTVAAAQSIHFLANTGTLGIGSPTNFASTVYGLQSGDVIDLPSASGSGSITAGVDSTHHLTVTQGGTTLASIAVDPTQDFSGLYFDAVASGGSVEVTGTTTPCFSAGTRIRTVNGDIVVEDLKEGDHVVTASGKQRPIRWIGRRSYKGHFVRGNRDVLPIRIKAGALADNVPSRDLCVSPLHAMLVGGFLIPAFKLVNGVTIVQVQDVEAVHYFHVELDSHDVLLAEDAPTESFVDDDSRDLFHNAPEYWAKHPRQPWRPARYCAPRIENGYELEEALHPLMIRAGLREPGSSPYGHLGELRGWVEECSPTRIAGWAQNMEFPHAGVVLSVFLGDEKLADIIANKQRADLEEAGIGDGRHAFEYRPKQPIQAARLHTVRMVRAMDREALPGLMHEAAA